MTMKLSKKTIEHLLSLVEFYADTSSGKEEDNAKANSEAWDELLTFQDTNDKPRTLCVETSGGVVQDVHGMPEGWDYEVADWDDAGESIHSIEQTIKNAKDQA